MKFTVKVDDRLTPDLSKKISQLKTIPQTAFNYFKDTTPKQSGNAKNKTVLINNTIVAGYEYADKLNSGSSKQAPQGMTKPTEKIIKQEIKKILGK
jgi:hypothetical protein